MFRWLTTSTSVIECLSEGADKVSGLYPTSTTGLCLKGPPEFDTPRWTTGLEMDNRAHLTVSHVVLQLLSDDLTGRAILFVIYDYRRRIGR